MGHCFIVRCTISWGVAVLVWVAASAAMAVQAQEQDQTQPHADTHAELAAVRAVLEGTPRNAYFGVLHLHAATADAVAQTSSLDFVALTRRLAPGTDVQRWQAEVNAARAVLERAAATTFVGFEPAPNHPTRPAHRQVIFQNHRVLEVTLEASSGGDSGEVWSGTVWDWMDDLRARGIDSLAVSEQLIRGWENPLVPDGQTATDWYRQRLRNEPLQAVAVAPDSRTLGIPRFPPIWFQNRATAAIGPTGVGLVAANPHRTPPPEPTAGPSGLTGVWAEDHSPEAIYAALRRRETFVTSGTRIQLRMVAGHRAPRLTRDPGVVMGDVLGAGRGPVRISAVAIADPKSQGLERLEVIKGWVSGGRVMQKTFELARSKPALDSVESRVCVSDERSVPTGEARLAGTWADPEFDRATTAYYMVRALEPASCIAATLRHTGPDPVANKAVATSIQQQALSSPVWYRPEAKRSG